MAISEKIINTNQTDNPESQLFGGERVWYHHYDSSVANRISIPDKALFTILDRIAKKRPGDAAFSCFGQDLTSYELRQKAVGLPVFLREMVSALEIVSLLFCPTCPSLV